MAAHAGSQLFVPFRALGFVANHVPLAIQSQGTENVVATAVGNAFHVYNVSEDRTVTVLYLSHDTDTVHE